MSDKILQYIQKHVTEWPDGADIARLYVDGEIVFDVDNFDFKPYEEFDGDFTSSEDHICCSKSYTREEWEGVTDLTKLDKPFGELDRATQLKLVEHVLDGGAVDFQLIDGEWRRKCDVRYETALLFVMNTVYRAI